MSLALLITVAGLATATAVGAGAQTEPPPEATIAEVTIETAPVAPVEPSTTPTEPTTPKTTSTLKPCEKTADLAVVFFGRPVVRSATIVTFNVESVVSGDIKPGTALVNFPLDDRFIFDNRPYRVAASYDAESKVYVSKVRPPRNTPAHCLDSDKIYTVHSDGKPIDTGIFAGMSGNWKRVPLVLIYPLGGLIGGLLVLVILKHSVWWSIRSIFRLFRRPPADA